MIEPGAESNLPAGEIPFEEANYAIEVMGRLRLDNAVRREAVHVLRGEPPESLNTLIGVLMEFSSDRWGELIAAAWALGRTRLTHDERDSVGILLMDILEQRRKARRGPYNFVRGFVRAIVPALLLGLLTMLVFGPPGTFEEFFLVTGVYSALLSPVFSPNAWFLFGERKHRVRAAAAHALGHLRMPESTGALAGGLFDRSLLVRETCADALRESLPSITSSHYGLLSAKSMQDLGRALRHDDGQLVGLILDALAKVGTSAVIGHVESLSQAGRTQRQRESAKAVLEILLERQKKERHSETLMRPAAAPETRADLLLRPAHNAESDPEMLLRPSNEIANPN